MNGSYERTSPHLRLQRITLRDGHASGTELRGGGGAIFYQGGSVTAVDTLFIDNSGVAAGPDIAGGAIFGIGLGQTTVVGCTFMGSIAVLLGSLAGGPIASSPAGVPASRPPFTVPSVVARAARAIHQSV